MNIEPRLIIFIGGLIALAGTFLTIYGTLMHNKASSEKSTKILKSANESLLTSKESLEKAVESLDKLVKIQEDAKLIKDNITGGNSYPLLEILLDDNSKISRYFLSIVGENNLNNLTFTSLNITDIEEFYAKYPEKPKFANYMDTQQIEYNKEYEENKRKAFKSSTTLNGGTYSPKSKELVGEHIADFSTSINGTITAISTEAANGKYYQLFNWGLIESAIKFPNYSVQLEDILFNEEGKILHDKLWINDSFTLSGHKINPLKKNNFIKVKEYFEEKKKMNLENKNFEVP